MRDATRRVSHQSLGKPEADAPASTQSSSNNHSSSLHSAGRPDRGLVSRPSYPGCSKLATQLETVPLGTPKQAATSLSGYGRATLTRPRIRSTTSQHPRLFAGVESPSKLRRWLGLKCNFLHGRPISILLH